MHEVQRLSAIVAGIDDNLRAVASRGASRDGSGTARGMPSRSRSQTRYWTEAEHCRFLEAIKRYADKFYRIVANILLLFCSALNNTIRILV